MNRPNLRFPVPPSEIRRKRGKTAENAADDDHPSFCGRQMTPPLRTPLHSSQSPSVRRQLLPLLFWAAVFVSDYKQFPVIQSGGGGGEERAAADFASSPLTH